MSAGVRVWRFPSAQLCISSAPYGGGIGERAWALNAQVPRDYARTDIERHVEELARTHGCAGPGVGMLTAVPVGSAIEISEDGVEVHATVGVSLATWAADLDGAARGWRPGTINVVVQLPVCLTPAALVNAVITVTEAKVQALAEAGVPGTGTATDAVCIACPPSGPAQPFGGPRSRIGAPLARLVHATVAKGLHR